jgi:hypothetical protein
VRAAAALLPVLLAAWVYFPVTRSYFFADDFVCLASILNDGFLRFVLRPFGGHNLLVRNLAFYGSYQLFGMRAELYFWTVLLTHLLNVWLLFRVLRNVTASLALACFGAALWGTSPVQVGTLGWYSVYGQVLVAAILLVVLDRATARAHTGTAPSARGAAAWYALLLIGTTCFGTGVGVALAFPVVLFLVLPAAWRHPGIRLAYLGLPLVVAAGYFGFRRLYTVFEPLTFSEVVAGNLSPPRVRGALLILPDLLAVSVDTSMSSTFFSAAQWPTGSTPIVLGVFVVGLAVVLWRGDAATRRIAVAMLVLATGIYLVIGLGRAPVGGATDDVMHWLASQSRYHYVGTIPMVVLICLTLATLGGMGPLRAVPRTPLLLAGLAVGTVGYLRSNFAIDARADVRRYVAGVQRGIAAEVDARAPGTTVYLENGRPSPVMLGPMIVKVGAIFPGRAAVFLITWPGDELNGRRVRFIERDPVVLGWIERWPDTPFGRLLVGPDALPR